MVRPARGIADRHAMQTAPGARFEIVDLVIDGVPTGTWNNRPATLRDLTANGRAFATRDVLIHEDSRVTVKGSHRAVVALVMRNLPEWPQTLPCGANGKIIKSDLKKVFAEEAVA